MDSFVTNASDPQRKAWLIKTMGRKGPGQYRPYRLIEVSHGNTYAEGVTNMAGSMTALPGSFVSTNDYDGYMQLQIGCYDEKGNIVWPDPGDVPIPDENEWPSDEEVGIPPDGTSEYIPGGGYSTGDNSDAL
jgi:hypothetical protein